jgi:uracil phosphoribosyltransferase
VNIQPQWVVTPQENKQQKTTQEYLFFLDSEIKKKKKIVADISCTSNRDRQQIV